MNLVTKIQIVSIVIVVANQWLCGWWVIRKTRRMMAESHPKVVSSVDRPIAEYLLEHVQGYSGRRLIDKKVQRKAS